MIAHADIVSQDSLHHDPIIRVDWNTEIDSKVDLHNWIRKAYEKGPVGFLTRPKQRIPILSGENRRSR